MVYQFDPELNPNGKDFLKQWGCYFCSLLKIAESQHGRKFGATEVYAIYLAAMQTGIVQKEVYDELGKPKDGCTVLDPDALLKLAGGKGKVRQVDGAGYRCAANEKQILHFFNPRTNFRHFVVGDGNGKVSWDPLENSVTAREGSVTDQRIVAE